MVELAVDGCITFSKWEGLANMAHMIVYSQLNY